MWVRVDVPRRGESERVAARVRTLLREHVGDSDGLSGEAPSPAASIGSRAPVSTWQRLVTRVPLRIDPGRRSAVALGLTVLVAAGLTGLWLLSAQPSVMPVSKAAPTMSGASPLLVGPLGQVSSARSAPSAAGPTSSPSSPADVVVDVAGQVRHPGLYRLPSGSRVDDAVKAAGGALRGVDLTSVNLAAKVVDGQQIAVGRTGAVGSPAGGGSGGSTGSGASGSASAGPVNLNTASLEQIETLPGIGPALGQRIVDYRTAHGPFISVDQLDDVSGIGTVTFARLKPMVTV